MNGGNGDHIKRRNKVIHQQGKGTNRHQAVIPLLDQLLLVVTLVSDEPVKQDIIPRRGGDQPILLVKTEVSVI